MRHAHSMSLNKEQVTHIYDLTREIMDKEGLSKTTLKIVPKVWRTSFITEGTRDRYTGEYFVDKQWISLGGKMLTGFTYPKKIYYISLYDHRYMLKAILAPRNIMLADVVASSILEEIAHAIVFNRVTVPFRTEVKSHGSEFKEAFKLLWKKYFITLKFNLMSVYGRNGFSGEDFL